VVARASSGSPTCRSAFSAHPRPTACTASSHGFRTSTARLRQALQRPRPYSTISTTAGRHSALACSMTFAHDRVPQKPCPPCRLRQPRKPKFDAGRCLRRTRPIFGRRRIAPCFAGARFTPPDAVPAPTRSAQTLRTRGVSPIQRYARHSATLDSWPPPARCRVVMSRLERTSSHLSADVRGADSTEIDGYLADTPINFTNGEMTDQSLRVPFGSSRRIAVRPLGAGHPHEVPGFLPCPPTIVGFAAGSAEALPRAPPTITILTAGVVFRPTARPGGDAFSTMTVRFPFPQVFSPSQKTETPPPKPRCLTRLWKRPTPIAP